ncbi:MAG TPA: hypothetical protein VLJ59_05570 [Mycobacteriales bacterium]|nr:hypothetical protein [Mycobacteriales bacterium]
MVHDDPSINRAPTSTQPASSLGAIASRIHCDPNDWVSWDADCPCGAPTTWYSRSVQAVSQGDQGDIDDPRYTTVEYRLACPCALPTAA